MRNGWVAIAMAAAALACAPARKNTAVASAAKSPAKNAQTYDTANGRVVCVYETTVGSHIPERRCFYKEDLDATRRETVDRLIQHTNTTLMKGGG